MAKIKKTKTVLKTQRDALSRFKRYLPTLELKKQQLKMEVNRAESEIDKKVAEKRGVLDDLKRWVAMFSEDVGLKDLIRLKAVDTAEDNIAGVSVPVFQEARFERGEIDLYNTPPWTDDGVRMIERLITLELEEKFLRITRDLINEELRITSQRVNLFEKVKIPEAQENIRVIKIALGDAQTAAVARAKTAKNKTSGEGAA